jgi:hypothetical protein
MVYSVFRSQISFQEMAIAFLSTSDKDRIGTLFKGIQQV